MKCIDTAEQFSIVRKSVTHTLLATKGETMIATKWTSQSGPRQTKAVNEALNKLQWRGKTRIELGDYGPRELTQVFSNPSEACQQAMAQIGEKYGYEITAENYRAIVADLQEATANLELPVDDVRSTEQERQERAAILENNRKEQEERTAKIKESSATILAKKPDWAEAVIVAELDEDDSDSMTDYFNHKTVRRVVIGWRKGKRESFPQLRKAAAQFHETAHLGPGKDRHTIRSVWADNSPGRYKGGYCRAFDLDGKEFDNKEAAEQAIAENTETLILDNHPCEYVIQSESYEHRENYSMGGGNYLKAETRHGNGWKVRSEPINYLTQYLYEDGLPGHKSEQIETGAGFEIQKHYHTKKNFDFWAVVLLDRVDSDAFNALRDSAKSAGGWYSRQWGSFPGGFCFETEEAAKKWTDDTFGSGDGAEPKEPKPDTSPAERLRSEADKLQRRIDDKTRPMTQNSTPKRTREYNARCHEGENLRRCQKAMHALADLHEQGTCPANLKGLRKKAEILPLVATRGDSQGYYDYRDTYEYRDTSSQGRELQALIEEGPEQRKARELEYMLQEVNRKDIAGYFPTPRAVAERMIELAEIEPGQIVLEPSAGTGELADVIREHAPVVCCEIRPAFREILKAKGHTVIEESWDFLEYNPGPVADRVISNPPFERQQDAVHVRKAYDVIRTGGRIVSVMAASVRFSSYYKSFRDWLADKGEIIDLPEGSFRESGTMVSTVLVVINK